MAKSGVRSPTSHRTPEQIREHGRTYQARPEVKKRRAERNRVAAEKGSSSTQDNAHSTPLVKKKTPGGETTKQSVAKNRGHGMGRNGTKPDKATTAMKSKKTRPYHRTNGRG
jgi:hypothetical protein